MKLVLKRVLFYISFILVAPLVVGARLERAITSNSRFFAGGSQLLSLVPFRIGVYLRAAYYCHACASVHVEVAIGFMTLLSHADTEMGRNVYIGAQSNIGSCSLGSDCLLGSGVHILSGKHQHNFDDLRQPIRNQGGTYTKIRIGKNCWIGNQATVMADVGDDCVIAAGAVVTEEVPPRSIVAGNPARVLKTR